jgi:phosphomannomutase
MNKTIFREYDIRGIVDTDFMISETDRLANAIGFFISEQKLPSKRIIIGRDGRPSSPCISSIIKEALIKSGFSVYDIGIVPSPVAYFAHHYYDSAAALIITASHNPAEYNGIKIVVDKMPVWGSQIQKIYSYYQEKKSINSYNGGDAKAVDAITEYVS